MENQGTISTSDADWKVSSVRLSLFPQYSTVIQGAELFRQFFGFPVQSQSVNRNNFSMEYSGELHNIHHQTIVTGPQVDFVTTAMIDTGKYPIEPAFFDNDYPYDSLLLEGFNRVRTGFKLIRFAIGHQFIMPVESAVAAHEKVNEILPFLPLKAAQDGDFLFRLNRREAFEIQQENGPCELVVNRLRTWSCLRLNVKVELANMPPMLQNCSEMVSCLTDVNTPGDKDYSFLTETGQNLLLEKLLLSSYELRRKGDL